MARPTVRIKVQARARVKVATIPKFPAQVVAGDGVLIDRTGGVFTFSLDPTFVPSYNGPFTVGDLFYADGAASVTGLPDVATGNVLLSGGVGVGPSYGKVSSSHVNSATGSGAFVFAASPTLTTPIITTPAITGGTVVSSAISGGTINNTPIGGTTRAAGAFTTVGVGTSAPSASLHVTDSSTIPAVLQTSSAAALLQLQNTDTTWYIGPSNAISAHAFGILDGASGFRLTIDTNGLVALNRNAIAAPTPPTGTIFHVAGADAAATSITVGAFAAPTAYLGRRANGTNASKTTLTSGDAIISFAALGYDGSAYTASPQAAIVMYGGGTWSGSSTPAYIDFSTTAASSTTLTARARIETDGGIIATPLVTGGSKGAGTVNVSGGYYISGTLLSAVSETLTSKTINLSSNTLSGTTAQFNTALSDNDFATLAGSETLTNKTITSPTITGATITGGTINNTPIGGSTRAAGAFTQVSIGAAAGSNPLEVTTATSTALISQTNSTGAWTIGPNGSGWRLTSNVASLDFLTVNSAGIVFTGACHDFRHLFPDAEFYGNRQFHSERLVQLHDARSDRYAGWQGDHRHAHEQDADFPHAHKPGSRHTFIGNADQLHRPAGLRHHGLDRHRARRRFDRTRKRERYNVVARIGRPPRRRRRQRRYDFLDRHFDEQDTDFADVDHSRSRHAFVRHAHELHGAPALRPHDAGGLYLCRK
jgi:hypothetical protein